MSLVLYVTVALHFGCSHQTCGYMPTPTNRATRCTYQKPTSLLCADRELFAAVLPCTDDKRTIPPAVRTMVGHKRTMPRTMVQRPSTLKERSERSERLFCTTILVLSPRYTREHLTTHAFSDGLAFSHVFRPEPIARDVPRSRCSVHLRGGMQRVRRYKR